ncbi:MAG: hypothetical protein IID58_08655 [Proteobacteria bacterium]|nr:hypothetical protein [Pseudomonadota bacterium]
MRILTERAAQQAQRRHPLGVHEVQRALGTTVITEESDTLRTVITVLSKHKAIGPERYNKHHREAVYV